MNNIKEVKKVKKINITKYLSSVFLFNSLENEDLELIAQFAEAKNLSKNAFLFHEETKADHFFIVITGKLKVFKISPEGNEQTLHIQIPGDMIAEAAIFDREIYPANCQTLEDSSVILIDSNKFKKLLSTNPQLSIKIMASYSRRLRQLTSLIEELSLYDTKLRLAKHLLKHAKTVNDQQVCYLDISKKELASLLGTIPETLSRTLQYWQKKGFIAIKDKGKSIVILNNEELQIHLNK